MDRYALDFATRTVANGRAGRIALDAAPRIHAHETDDVTGLDASLASLAATDALLSAAIEAIADRILVHEDGEVLTGSGNVLMMES